jgi:hypothetical protein
MTESEITNPVLKLVASLQAAGPVCRALGLACIDVLRYAGSPDPFRTWWSTKSGCLAAIAHGRLWHSCKKFLQVTSQKVAGEQFYTDAIRPSDLALLWQIFAADERDGIPKSVFQ